MRYTDNIRQASWRGIPFNIREEEAVFEPKIVEHKFPGSLLAFLEVMGDESNEFIIDGYVVGEDFGAQRDRLINACKEHGEGTLVMPHYGSITAKCLGIRPKHSTSELRICRFSIRFKDTTGLVIVPGPLLKNSTSGKIIPTPSFAKDAPQELKVSAFHQILDTCKEGIAKVADILMNPLTGVYHYIDLSFQQAEQVLGIVYSAFDLIYDLQTILNISPRVFQLLSDARGKGIALIINSQSLGETIQNLMTFGLISFDDSREDDETTPDYRAGFSRLSRLAAFSPSIQQSSDSSKALLDFVRVTAAIQLMQISSKINYSSVGEADTYRGVIVDLVDYLVGLGLDEELVTILRSLQALTNQDIEDRASSLPSYTVYMSEVQIPSLALAYQLYGNLSLEQDLVSRNEVTNPMLIPSGVNLEVVANG